MRTPNVPIAQPWHLSRSEVLKLLAVFGLWRVALFIIGAVAGNFLKYQPSFPYSDTILATSHLPQWLYSWANFDGVHYITIAEKGYFGTGLIQAFFPFFPIVLLRSLYLLTAGHLNTLAAGLVITNLAALAAVLLWYIFLKSILGAAKAWLGVLVLLAFPTSLFFGAFYTESLFFLAIIGAFWAAQQRHWWLVAFATMVATSTRVVGIFLLPALALELWLQWRNEQPHKTLAASLSIQVQSFVSQNWKQLVLIAVGSLGLLIYMLYLWKTFGDPLYFLHVQSEFGAGRSEGFVIYPQVLWRSIKILLTVPPNSLGFYTVVLEFLAGSVALLGLLIAAFRVRLSYVIFALGAFFTPTFTGTFSSMPRYILVCFPLYLLLADWLVTRPKTKAVVLTIFVISLAINTVIFIQGYWLS